MHTLLRSLCAGLAALAVNAGAAETVKIAVIDPMSGPFANVGEAMVRHVRLAIDLVNERGTGVVPQVFSVTGTSTVSSGGKGQMRVLIDFNDKARIEEILEKNRIERGKRPTRTNR